MCVWTPSELNWFRDFLAIFIANKFWRILIRPNSCLDRARSLIANLNLMRSAAGTWLSFGQAYFTSESSKEPGP